MGRSKTKKAKSKKSKKISQSRNVRSRERFQRLVGTRRLPLRPGQVPVTDSIRTGRGYNVCRLKPSVQQDEAFRNVGLESRPHLKLKITLVEPVDDEEHWYFRKTVAAYKHGTNQDIDEVFRGMFYDDKLYQDFIRENPKVYASWFSTEPDKTFKIFKIRSSTVYNFTTSTKPFYFQISLRLPRKDGTIRAHALSAVYVPQVKTLYVLDTQQHRKTHWFLEDFLKTLVFPNVSVIVYPTDTYTTHFNLQRLEGVQDTSAYGEERHGLCQDFAVLVPYALAKEGVFETVPEWSVKLNQDVIDKKMVDAYIKYNRPSFGLYNELRRQVGILGGRTRFTE